MITIIKASYHKNLDYIHLPENTVLKYGKYTIIKTLQKRSNFSIVYTAFTNKNKKVVIKEYYPQNLVLRDLDGKTLVAIDSRKNKKYNRLKDEFLYEALIMKEFSQSEHICNVIDFFWENNSAYIVMQFYEGKSLEDVILTENINLRTFFKKIYIPLLQTVHILHRKKYIHRDLKPNNIIIYREKPILIDFGSAINYHEKQDKKILLSPGFSPIEFYSGRTGQGPYSDIYSLAAILYYYFTKNIPMEASERIIEDNINDLQIEVGKEYSGFARVIMNNLSLNKKNRCKSIKSYKFLLLKDYYKYLFKSMILKI
ncbi:MAG: protein kinase domain-containing protein [bacterium]